MIKLLAVLLIFALLLPALALADDLDPIVGHWYFLYDSNVSPELAPNFGDYDFIILVYSFLADGTILQAEIDVKDKSGTPFSSAAGKWEKDGYNYSFSIIGFGSGKAFIENDCLLLETQTPNIYLRVRKLAPFDAYSDYVIR